MPRQFNLQLPEDLFERAKKDIPWGMKTQLIVKLLERVLDSHDHYGTIVYGAIIAGDFDIRMKGMTRYEQIERAKGGPAGDGQGPVDGENPGGKGRQKDKQTRSDSKEGKGGKKGRKSKK